ncbi:type II secretion system protein [Kribbella sp. ALI-6-A]|uniref:type II secretion system F family protein n=1 Tax=Kribbella sp. ALI-6-A TaxID=1933817 RepID=UPI00097C2617|nr:type II secretion system F family protein [Kribbella sp. ALI-6-A]ONI67312.1 type II secretion system protein [Kribbella sp. ALI-6-A]
MNHALASAALTLLAVLTVFPRKGRALHRLTTPSRGSTSAAHLARSARRRLLPLAFGTIVALGIGLSFGPPAVVTTVGAATILTVVLTQRAKSRHQAQTNRKRFQIIEACDILAADLTAGRPPQEALEGAAEACPDLRPAAAAARLGGDVPAVLHLAAETPGAEPLKPLAAAWQVADHSGAALATIIDRLTTSLRAEEALHRQITTNLAGARTTARLLTALPLFGTLLGYALGADPLTFLTSTVPGAACLAAGLALSLTGLHWTNHLAESP